MNSNEMSELRSIWDEAKGHIERGDYDKAVEIYKTAQTVYQLRPDGFTMVKL